MPKAEQLSPGTADNRELARVQRRTIGRTRQNTHRTINPHATGPRTSPRLSRARRGRFRGERLSPRWPQLCLSQQQGLAGVPQDTGAKQTSRPLPGSKFLRFRWGGREVNRQPSHGLAAAPYLPAGPSTPQLASLGGPRLRRLFVLATKPREQRERPPWSAHRCRQRGGLRGTAWGCRWGRGGSPMAQSGAAAPREGDSGQPCSSPHQDPNSLKLPGAKPQLDSLHGLRGSCVQNRLVYCVLN